MPTPHPPVVRPTENPVPAPASNESGFGGPGLDGPSPNEPVSDESCFGGPGLERPGLDRGRAAGGECGQATAEYALVMLAAAALAGLLLAWASRAGGVDRLMNAVMDTLVSQVG